MFFSKSKYCGLWQCPKIAWLKKYKPEEYVVDEGALVRMDNGNEIGDLAMKLFGEYTEVTVHTEEGKLDIPKMIELTKQYIDEGKDNICEASFSYEGLYCAVDILKKQGDGWAIYEVKSSTHQKYVYMVDISYQKYVLERCGIKITGTYLVNINNDYVFDGNLEIDKLFKITDVMELVVEEEKNVEKNLEIAEKILDDENEPATNITESCHTPYTCGFWKYCTKCMPNPSVFDLYGVYLKNKIDYYKQNLISFEDFENANIFVNEIANRQIDYTLHDKGVYVDKEKIKEFLDTLHYPLYFLDFESQALIIPQYVGTKPYQHIPFQYSLHYIEHEGGELKHKEFLGISGEDPRRAIAEALCNDIPENACVLAYNKSYECGRIGMLAETFPDLQKKLSIIEFNIIDLIIPFQKGYYYKKEMGGSFSIKSVLPAMFPNDPSLNYHNLDGVHNGNEAMNIYPKIKDMSPEEQKVARRNLLKYCELDTLAMVKIWQELVESAKDDTKNNI